MVSTTKLIYIYNEAGRFGDHNYKSLYSKLYSFILLKKNYRIFLCLPKRQLPKRHCQNDIAKMAAPQRDE